jgi:hypothetical protein
MNYEELKNWENPVERAGEKKVSLLESLDPRTLESLRLTA